MLDKSLLFILILIAVLRADAYKRKSTDNPFNNPWDNPSEQECSDRVHRKCTHPESYTEEDVERARIWLQKRFEKSPNFNPNVPPCEKLHVRKDIKCMSQKEIDDVVTVILQLYADGTMTRMAKLHFDYWKVEHKFIEGAYWHWWFVNELELQMKRINPDVFMPYWDFQNEFTGAEKSLMWDIFGRAGNASNDYCITGSRFEGNSICGYPTPHCVRRQWNDDGTIPAWEPGEWLTLGIQTGPVAEVMTPGFLLIFQFLTPDLLVSRLNLFLSILARNICPTQIYFNVAFLTAVDSHFKTHLYIGGWKGDMSVRWAPCDIVFYIFHEGLNMYFRKWQLQSDENIIPDSWSLALRYETPDIYSYTDYTITATDIKTDTMLYYTNVTIAETFQFTFGQQCYIHDQMIKPINDIIKKKKYQLPIVYYRLKEALPPNLFAKYFPKMANCPEEVSYFDHIFSDVGNCNQNCKRMPIAANFTSTANGLRQWNLFANTTEGGIDTTLLAGPGEAYFWRFMQDLNKYGYCSPYVA